MINNLHRALHGQQKIIPAKYRTFYGQLESIPANYQLLAD